MPMPLNIGWGEIALRLALTVAAGILIGINRSEHGHSAGLRTTLGERQKVGGLVLATIGRTPRRTRKDQSLEG